MNISKLKDICRVRKKLREDLRRAPQAKMELTPDEMHYCEIDIMMLHEMKKEVPFDEDRN